MISNLRTKEDCKILFKESLLYFINEFIYFNIMIAIIFYHKVILIFKIFLILYIRKKKKRNNISLNIIKGGHQKRLGNIYILNKYVNIKNKN